jgi:hypothetical protein
MERALRKHSRVRCVFLHVCSLRQRTRRETSCGPCLSAIPGDAFCEAGCSLQPCAAGVCRIVLAQTGNPHYPGRFEYIRPKKGRNWHLTDFAEMIREMAAHVRNNAPPQETTNGATSCHGGGGNRGVMSRFQESSEAQAPSPQRAIRNLCSGRSFETSTLTSN